MRAVQGQESFFNKDGAVFSSLAELAQNCKTMSQDVFNYHCNSQKCDFASWIETVLHDETLAQNIVKAKGVRLTIESHIQKRIAQLSKYQ